VLETLPEFRYHPDPIMSGSIAESMAKCRVCKKARGYIYTAPAYAEEDLDEAICPWCIASGAANKKFDATFVDSEAFADGIPDSAMEEIMERTPGFATWQSEHWPACCGDATAFLTPAGINEIRKDFGEYQFSVMNHIIYDMKISGSAATRLLDSLNRDSGPTAYIFRCLHCDKHHFHIDQV
jgi:uncharacterized protein CbrC (UPF0167 family)